jgi:glycosyltransferase involved in cell wall biosynthesis
VNIVRAGRQWTVHWAAFRNYRRKLSQNFDVVIDEVNTIPFFTPAWADVPTVMFIHQLAREVWWYESPFPMNALGYLAEPWYLRPYRDVRVLTVSSSTRNDLRKLGFRGPISIIPEGVEPIVDSVSTKPTEPTFLYVGRLARSKRVDHTIRAFELFHRRRSEGRLRLVGSGSAKYTSSLNDLVHRLDIEDSVTFLGQVSTAEKHRLMSQAHALLMTSVREGWGLVVSEANACGTPAIVYDVPGLRDSVVHDSTGLVVAPCPTDLADAMDLLVRDQPLYERLAMGGRELSASLSFDRTTDCVSQVLEASLAR